jgi:acyl dehydratase
MSGNADAKNDDQPTLADVTESWSDASYHVLNSYLEANRALVAALGFPSGTSASTPTPRSAPAARPPAPEPQSAIETAESTPELAGVANDWETERSVETREELGVDEYVRFTKRVTDGDVYAFAGASGDTNRLHLGDEFAAGTRFGGRIAHGTLASGLISAALARLPGLVIYLSQDLEFRAPVGIGDRVAADCEVVEDLGDYRYRLSTAVTDADTGDVVIGGEAVILLDEEPKNAE